MTTQSIDGFPAETVLHVPAAKWENLKANVKEARAAAKEATERAVKAETALAELRNEVPVGTAFTKRIADLEGDLYVAITEAESLKSRLRVLGDERRRCACDDLEKSRNDLIAERDNLIEAIDLARQETEATKGEVAELRRCAEETAGDLRQRLEIAGNERDSWKAVAERRGRELDGKEGVIWSGEVPIEAMAAELRRRACSAPNVALELCLRSAAVKLEDAGRRT